MIYVKSKQQKTKELEFLHSFKDTDFFESYTSDLKYNYTFIEEPYTGFGYPDLVLLTWDKKIENIWKSERNDLTRNDIKIVQHLYNCNEPKSIENISVELGFTKAQVEKIIKNLFNAEFIDNKNDCWRLKELTDLFYLKEIITVEAKLKNWRNALSQAWNNECFSSEVFTLFPDNIINKNLLESYSKTDIGVIAFNNEYEVVKRSKKKDLPVTINGWLFNELVGRMLWQEN
ncbi:MAG: hypothetical protein PF693_12500 [Spirochaetia bacterium]|jgi:predicted transcriptional regulator|nr:hypothetical protein [Spirochaetia bacterium]